MHNTECSKTFEITSILPDNRSVLSGLASAISIPVNMQILLDEGDASQAAEPRRSVLCGVLVSARFAMVQSFQPIMFFSFGCRFFLVIYAEGLVRNGKPNLKLLSQLFWLVTGTFLIESVILSYPRLLINGPQESTRATICLLLSLNTFDDEKLKRNTMITCMMMFIAIFFLFYFYARYIIFMTKFCPKKSRTCIAVYPRNIMSLKDTAKFSLFWSLFPALDVILIIIFRQLSLFFSPKLVFLVRNIIWLFLCDIFNLCVSFFYLNKDIPCKNVRSTFQNFYVRNPVKLEPRRNQPITSPGRILQSPRLCLVTPVLAPKALHTELELSEASVPEFGVTSVPQFSLRRYTVAYSHQTSVDY